MNTVITRRLFLGSAFGLGTIMLVPGVSLAEDIVRFNFLQKKGIDFPYKLSDKQWYDRLGQDGYNVLRGGENETSGTSPLLRERRRGTYQCRGCGQPLFSSNMKVMANDWPTFRTPINNKVLRVSADYGHLLPRTEVHCANCGSHMGYKFMAEGSVPETFRYSINGTSLAFKPVK